MDDFEEYRKKHREAYQRRRENPPPGGPPLDHHSAHFSDHSDDPYGDDGHSNDHPVAHTTHSFNHQFDPSNDSADAYASFEATQPSVACRSSSSLSVDTIQSTIHTNSPALVAVDPRFGDPEYESSIELAKKLQEEFDRHASQEADEHTQGVRRPDESYTECLLPDVPQGSQFDQSDVDLQRAIAKSLIDM